MQKKDDYKEIPIKMKAKNMQTIGVAAKREKEEWEERNNNNG